MALGLALVTPSAVTASPTAAPTRNDVTAQAACPPEGTRFHVDGHGSIVFLIGPEGFQYQLLDAGQYSALWGGWDGIQPDAYACLTHPRVMWDVHLVKRADSDRVYVYDGTFTPGCYRPIVDSNTFHNKYHFDPSKIITYPLPRGVICDQHPWT